MDYKEIIVSIPQENRITIPTPLGEMIAIADIRGLHALQFIDYPFLESLVKRVRPQLLRGEKSTHFLVQTQQELQEYFAKKRKIFTLPFVLSGTEFQIKAWKTLCSIPYGTTRSYQQQAMEMGIPKAVRAVGSANGKNPLILVIPCHRIVPSQKAGKVLHPGGYSSGTDRKKRLLEIEGVC